MPDFLISNFDIGLEKDLDPYLITEKAFPELEDAFVFRGRVIRRTGFTTLGRLRRVIPSTNLKQTTTAGLQTIIVDLLADVFIGFRATQPNAEIQPGSVTITVGASSWNDATTPGVLTPLGGTAAAGTINYATGEIVLNFTAPDGGGNVIAVVFNYFPALPVMGLRRRELIDINLEQTVAFDTRYAYRNVAGAWEELPSNTPTVWNGANAQFFWTTNYRGSVSSEQFFWATNFNQNIGGGDPIYYYDPNAAPATWTSFAPTVNGANELHQCLIILPFKNRLIALNTWEGAALNTSVQYPQRCRYSQNGDPTDTANGWRDDVVGRGGYIDAPTSEMISSAQFVKDRLIVFFERSTWELLYTGNEILPFVWQKINTELGAESTFSEIPFDEGVLSIGDTGIHFANTSEVARIDVVIPDEVGKIKNTAQGKQRVYGIRDYNNEVAYWTIPSSNKNLTFPDKVLLYNYRNKTFAFFNDSFTCYGYFQRVTSYTWATLPYKTWSEWIVPWNTGYLQGEFRQIIAGNQQGFTFLFDGSSTNDNSLTVTAIAGNAVTSPNHNLSVGQYIKFSNLTGVTITPVAPNTTQTFKVMSITSANVFTIDGTAAGAYPGGGLIEVLNNFSIKTKQFDFFPNTYKISLINEFEFLLDKTQDGEITLEIFKDFNGSVPLPVSIGTKSVYTAQQKTSQQNQDKIWHKSRRSARGQSLQLQLTMSDAQMRDPDIQSSKMVLHAILMKVEPVGKK